MKKHRWSYLAGLFDGEGSFTISNLVRHDRPAYAFREIFITNTNVKIMDWLSKNFGGKVRVSRYGDKGWKDVYKWHASAKDHKYIIRNILPFLIVKKKQAEKVLEFILLKEKQNTKRGPIGLSKEEWQKRNSILIEVRALNKKAVNTALRD
jgi:hypothetical protein